MFLDWWVALFYTSIQGLRLIVAVVGQIMSVPTPKDVHILIPEPCESVVAQLLSRVRLFATPWTAASQPSLAPIISPPWVWHDQTHIHWVSDAIHHLILHHPCLLLPSIFCLTWLKELCRCDWNGTLLIYPDGPNIISSLCEREIGRSKLEKAMWWQKQNLKKIKNRSRGERLSKETFGDNMLLTLKREQGTMNQGKEAYW